MGSIATEFKSRSRQMSRDLRHRALIRTGLRKYEAVRDKSKAAFHDWEAARQAAAEIKWEAINHLDKHLVEFVERLEARGTQVHWASTGQQARDIILGIIRDKKARSIIKSKAMTAEEIHLNEALEHAGFEVVESDLGEFIVQLRKEPPYHIVFPAMHLTRGEISELFTRVLGSAPTDNPEELTMIARRALRQKYIHADVGITGANFAIAETGMISITENEGNARLTAALPKVMITLVGIEKILPRLEDLALFLPMLATAGTGQSLTCYNSLYGGPRQKGGPMNPGEPTAFGPLDAPRQPTAPPLLGERAGVRASASAMNPGEPTAFGPLDAPRQPTAPPLLGERAGVRASASTIASGFGGSMREVGRGEGAAECDGPEEYHVVLLDNRRTELLADAEQRDALHCIRCGACLNVCPIFRNVGGHTYGTTYSGPIGSVITPHLRGLQDWKHLSGASSLCGACTETCPVKINLHHHLLHNRRNAVRQKASWLEKIGFNIWAMIINNTTLYSLARRAGRILQGVHPLVKGRKLDPLYGWTQTRELPPIAAQTFKEWWRRRNDE